MARLTTTIAYLVCLFAFPAFGAECNFQALSVRQSTEPLQSAKLTAFMDRYYQSLGNDYRTPDGKYAEACVLIAFDAAEILLAEGRQPHVLSFRGKEIWNGKNEALKPVRYDGRLEWGGHMVMMEDGIVYDPMLGKPIPLKEYPMAAFGTNDVQLVRDWGPDEVKKKIK